VLLTSSDGASIDLRISGYQFPDREATGKRDWDANWLNVRGNITQADGKSWTFEDPSMTTWEAQALGAWLQGTAAGAVSASPAGTDEQLLAFTEPNLAFGVESRTGDQVSIRVHFSLEALPPWLQGWQRPDVFDYFVLVDLSVVELAQAADSWARDLTVHPER
jgi:hypothetical protein